MRAFNTHNRGFTLLFSIIISSVLLAIGISILAITIKQFSLSGISRSSEMAFYAANAGAECLRLYDTAEIGGDVFDVPGDGSIDNELTSITCFGQTMLNETAIKQSGREQRYEATWGATNNLCTDATIWKYYEAEETDADSSGPLMLAAGVSRRCPEGAECTIIKSRGYNRACADVGLFDRVVERELTLVY